MDALLPDLLVFVHVYWSTLTCSLHINYLYISTDKLVIRESKQRDRLNVNTCVHTCILFVHLYVEHCSTIYLHNIWEVSSELWKLCLLLVAVAVHTVWQNAGTLETLESAGCSQWPRVKSYSEICSPKNKNHDIHTVWLRKWEMDRAVQLSHPKRYAYYPSLVFTRDSFQKAEL